MNESCRKVVVTGMGAVTPFGVGVAPLWNGVSSGRSGIDWIRSLGDLDPEDYRRFVCLEMGNLGAQRIALAPGARHVSSVRIRNEGSS